MSIKIYTKTGDKGTTSLIGGTKVLKSDMRLDAYGTVDELNSWVGLISDLLNNETLKNDLMYIQDKLFTIGSALATDSSKETKMFLPSLEETDVQFLEKKIDEMTEHLPELKSFILPGGHTTISNIHIGRCVCRRAERLTVAMQQHELAVDEKIIRYLNRLSDYLFTLARYASLLLGVKENLWQPRSNQK